MTIHIPIWLVAGTIGFVLGVISVVIFGTWMQNRESVKKFRKAGLN